MNPEFPSKKLKRAALAAAFLPALLSARPARAQMTMTGAGAAVSGAAGGGAAGVVSQPMSARTLTALKDILRLPAGAAGAPQLARALEMIPASPDHLQALGPLAARLTADFLKQARAADSSEAAQAALARRISGACRLAEAGALAEIDARAAEAARAAACESAALRRTGVRS